MYIQHPLRFGAMKGRRPYTLRGPQGSGATGERHSHNGDPGSQGKRSRTVGSLLKKAGKAVQCILSRFSTKMVKIKTVHRPTS